MHRLNNGGRLYGAVIALLLIFTAIVGTSAKVFPERYELQCKARLLEASLDTALAQEGIKEKTNRNDGEVEKYLRIFGLRKGNPYCAAGQYWCFYQAAQALKLDIKDIPVKKTASSVSMADDAKKRGRYSKAAVKKNDLIIWRKAGSRRGHIERIAATGKAGNVTTIAFNVKKGNTEGVFLMKRNLLYPLSRMALYIIIGFREAL